MPEDHNNQEAWDQTIKIDTKNLSRRKIRSAAPMPDPGARSPTATSNNIRSLIGDTCRNILSGITSMKIIDWNDTSGYDDAEPINTESDPDILNNELEDLEKYIEIKQEIARGGQARINKAYDRRFNRTIVVKSLHDDLKEKKHYRQLFISEGRVTAQLEHPSIIPIYGVYKDSENGLHLTMKLIRGKTLKEYLSRTRIHYRTISPIERIKHERTLLWKRMEVFRRICDAIAYVHYRKVIHRDLKPENIMIGSFNETYIMDWGIAEFHDGKKENTGNIAGTLQYIAPEIMNRGPYDHRSDIFLLGLILYELVFLKQAYAPVEKEQDAIIKARCCRFEPFEHLFGCKVNKDMKKIIAKALAPNPDKRYQSVKELTNDLRNLEMGEEITANPDNIVEKNLRRLRHHYRGLIYACLSLVFLFIMVSAVALVREITSHYNIQRRDAALADIYSNGIISCSQLDSYFKNYEFLLSSCANAAELLLQSDPSSQPEYKFHTYRQVRQGGVNVEGLEYSTVYDRDISFRNMVYLMPPGVDTPGKSLEATMKQLYPLRKTLYNAVFGSLKPVLPALSTAEELEDAARNKTMPPLMIAYVGTRDGMTVGFPFELDHTDDYDPRTRSWYQNAVKTPELITWSKPYVDIGAAKQIVLTCSQAITDDKGEVLAVAAADISWSYLLKLLDSTGNNGRYVISKVLVNENGSIVAEAAGKLSPDTSGDTAPAFRPFEPERLLNSMWRRKNGWMFIPEDGVQYLYFFMEIKTLKWLYIEKINFDEFIKSQ